MKKEKNESIFLNIDFCVRGGYGDKCIFVSLSEMINCRNINVEE
jgi:hypothetical protein